MPYDCLIMVVFFYLLMSRCNSMIKCLTENVHLHINALQLICLMLGDILYLLMSFDL